jgi:uncharacterized protein YhbP (UPF0306 family)
MTGILPDLSCEHPDYPSDLLAESILDVLGAHRVLAMASIHDGMAHANAAFYCFNEKLELFFLSDEHSVHSRNFVANESVAVTVFDSSQTMASPKRGLQIFGSCAPAGMIQATEALRLWLRRFPEIKRSLRDPATLVRGLASQRFYTVLPASVKLLDEVRFGKREPIPVTLRRGARVASLSGSVPC